MADQILQTIVSLAGVVMLIVGCGFFLKRLTANHAGAAPRQGPLHVVSSLSLGLKEKLLLVQVGEQQILLAVSQGRIETLQTYDTPVVTNVDQAAQLGEFQRKLQTMLAPQPGRARQMTAGQD